MTFSVNKLHELTGVDRRTIKKRLVEAGVIPSGDGYPANLAFRAIFSPKAPDIADSEARISAANARTAEVKANKAEEKVLESPVVDLAWSEAGIYVARGLEIIPSKVESRYVPGMTAPEVGELVRQELHDALSELSKPITYQESEDAKEAAESFPGNAEAEAEAAD